MKYAINLQRVALVAAILVFAIGTSAQRRAFTAEYTVTLANPAAQQFHVTTTFSGLAQPRLDVSLPTWAPGWYTVENYFKNVSRFRVTDEAGNVLPARMTKKQTWSIDTRGRRNIKIDYDYRATVLGLNQAKIAPDYAFFTGIQLFLEPVGHRNSPSRVRFQIPDGWRLATALSATPDPNVFTASDYDTLVDAPALMGRFDMTEFEVEGKKHYFTAVPAGVFNADKTRRFTQMLSSTISAQSKIFGGLPYEKYIAFYFFQPAESNASGALEHSNSYVAFAPAGERTTPEQIIGTGSHEFFHLWNVKRIRPAEMWPYDYSRENESPLLWVSEGFTNYYGALGTYRAGVTSREQFLAGVANAASAIEATEARKYISPANSSVSTWVGYDTPVAFGISYYTQGQNLAALLDLSIRHDTNGRRSLDDVMRTLYTERYMRGRGFDTADLIQVINRTTQRNYTQFFERYVFGTEVPDYDAIFGYAGFAVTRTPQTTADLGFSARPRNGGLAIIGLEPNGAALASGMRMGDVITKVNGDPVFSVPFGNLAQKQVKLNVMRDGRDIEIQMRVPGREFTTFTLSERSDPTPLQLRVRNGWLERAAR